MCGVPRGMEDIVDRVGLGFRWFQLATLFKSLAIATMHDGGTDRGPGYRIVWEQQNADERVSDRSSDASVTPCFRLFSGH